LASLRSELFSTAIAAQPKRRRPICGKLSKPKLLAGIGPAASTGPGGSEACGDCGTVGSGVPSSVVAAAVVAAGEAGVAVVVLELGDDASGEGAGAGAGVDGEGPVEHGAEADAAGADEGADAAGAESGDGAFAVVAAGGALGAVGDVKEVEDCNAHHA